MTPRPPVAPAAAVAPFAISRFGAASFGAAFAAVALAMLALDAVWLGLLAASMYRAGIGHLMLAEPVLPAALAFYLVYAAGLVTFVVQPQSAGARSRTALMGALFGCVAYGTYDLSNLATLRGWPVGLALVDIAWGALASAAASVAGRVAAEWLAGRRR